MARLPVVGGDDNTWGDILNEFLSVEHNPDGTQKTLPVAKGGTGATSLTGILKGNGTSAFSTVSAPAGDIVGTTDSQSLTNKTISGANNTLTVRLDQTDTTGTLPLTKGGTGQVSAAAARGASGLNIEHRVTFANTNYTVNATDRYVGQTGTMSAARTVTLPAANGVAAGYEIVIADESGSVTSANKISVVRAGSDTIDGLTSVDIAVAYGFRILRSDGTSKWTVVGTSVEGTEAANLATMSADMDSDDTILILEDGVLKQGTQTRLAELARLGGRSGGQTLQGGTGIAENLTLEGSSNDSFGSGIVIARGRHGTVHFRGESVAIGGGGTALRVDHTYSMVNTTNATITTLATLNQLQTSNTVAHFESTIVAFRTGGSAGTAGDYGTYVRRWRAANKGGTVTVTSLTDVFTSEDVAGYDVTVDVSGTSIRIRVTGVASTNITWAAHTLIYGPYAYA